MIRPKLLPSTRISKENTYSCYQTKYDNFVMTCSTAREIIESPPACEGQKERECTRSTQLEGIHRTEPNV